MTEPSAPANAVTEAANLLLPDRRSAGRGRSRNCGVAEGHRRGALGLERQRLPCRLAVAQSPPALARTVAPRWVFGVVQTSARPRGLAAECSAVLKAANTQPTGQGNWMPWWPESPRRPSRQSNGVDGRPWCPASAGRRTGTDDLPVGRQDRMRDRVLVAGARPGARQSASGGPENTRNTAANTGEAASARENLERQGMPRLGLEPRTRWLRASCSTKLSYRGDQVILCRSGLPVATASRLAAAPSGRPARGASSVSGPPPGAPTRPARGVSQRRSRPPARACVCPAARARSPRPRPPPGSSCPRPAAAGCRSGQRP